MLIYNIDAFTSDLLALENILRRVGLQDNPAFLYRSEWFDTRKNNIIYVMRSMESQLKHSPQLWRRVQISLLFVICDDMASLAWFVPFSLMSFFIGFLISISILCLELPRLYQKSDRAARLHRKGDLVPSFGNWAGMPPMLDCIRCYPELRIG